MATMISAIRILQNSETEEKETFGNKLYGLATENYLAFVGIVIGCVVFISFAVCFLKAYCKQRYNIEICPGASGRRRNDRDDQLRVLQQERFSQALQMELDEEERRLARHNERRLKYEALVKENKMIIEEKDFYWQDVIDTGASAVDSKDIEMGSTAGSEELRSTTSNDHLLLTLPVKNEEGEVRRVSGHCAICIAEYTVGETVVWSTNNNCPHAYHENCILTWLARGKKRCPICRKTFAPTTINLQEVKDLPEDDEIDDAESERSQQSDNEVEENEVEEGAPHVVSEETVEAVVTP